VHHHRRSLRQRVCDNSSTQGFGVLKPQCSSSEATKRVIIYYDTKADYSEMSIHRLCPDCAERTKADASRQGYESEIIALD